MNNQFNPERLAATINTTVKRVLEAQNKAVVTGMFDLQADLLTRVFTDGVDSNGTAIGNYSTRPMYYSLKNKTSQVRSSSLKPSGKFSKKSEFKNGNQRKSQYFAGGYSEFRKVVGRQNAKVDLRLTGSLQLAIQVGVSQNTVTLGFNNDEQFKKAEGNEKRFNKVIFSASEAELDTLEEKWAKDVTDAYYESFE